jgi:spore coat polysaccharide biosynthesis predicted glycosyltransferase SpsG
MITMGGIDADDATSTVLRAIKRAILPEDVQISVVMGRCAPALDSVRLLAASMPWVTEVLVDVPDMAALMADADLAILAGGSTNWERCCLGLPGIIVLTAENQKNSAAAMVQAGAALCAGQFSDSEFSDRLLDAVGQIQVAELWQERSSMAASICRGGGALRVADAIGVEKWK